MMNTMQHIIFLFGLLLLANHCDAYTISHCALNPRIRLLAKQPTRTASLTMASSVLHSTTSESQNDNNEKKVQPLRGKLRKITGFSLTAFRSSWRAATGISLTALYASAVAASGLWIRTTMSKILSIIPDWARYFIQPFLVLYYAPLFILRGLTGPTRKAAIAKHNTVVDGWKQAVERAEEKMNEENGSTYLPAHVNDDGDFELDGSTANNTRSADSQKLADAVAESVEQASELNNNKK